MDQKEEALHLCHLVSGLAFEEIHQVILEVLIVPQLALLVHQGEEEVWQQVVE